MLPTTKYDIGNDIRVTIDRKIAGVLVASTDKNSSTGVIVAGSHRDMVEKLFKKDNNQSMMLLHAVMGIAGEAGELVDAIKKHVFFGKELDKENVVEELGDILFYLEAMAQLLNVSKMQLMAHNVDKLLTGDKARHKSGTYSDEAQVARADKQGENVGCAGVQVQPPHTDDLLKAVPPAPPAASPRGTKDFCADFTSALRLLQTKAYLKFDEQAPLQGENWKTCHHTNLVSGLQQAIADADWASVVNYATMLHERERILEETRKNPPMPYRPGVGR
ncbi:nucleotide pyrophosphohydrolase [Pantoea phage vB_PagS_Vid5]|uniref:Nucleotide pyrophosphohydrolase n=1 Tax=Pantoea phage vB_PagS_Vid5 TaxID=2099652 RepID=A0A2P1CKU6_9CAUD|nr:MazG-like pyrophosphatase [Pantoea phage vB_PagS_Vid5]AVJ51808.1 nucleotide pyrophosphohydrolase [Pantoea phage vB_PagS_Vid5]